MIAVLLIIFVPLLLLSLWLFARFSAQKPRVYVAPASPLEKALESHMPCLYEVFHPTWWCPFGFLQTAVRQLFRSCPSLPFERELVSFDDGGELAIDWMNPEGVTDSSPVVIFFPGITGSTHDCSYILHAVVECAQLQYRSVVINPRGLGGVILKTAQTYNAAWTSDVRHVIEKISVRYPNAPKIGIGFSMGGMILWNYLADCESAKATNLNAAMCISSPFDPMDATFTIEEFFPRIFFNSHLAENLKRIVRPYKTMFEGRCNWEDVMACKTVREFDKAFVVPVFGYKDWPEYYHAAALYWKVHKIPIPTLCLNAADDCFSPLKSIPFPEVVRSDNVAVAVTQHGGHTAFMRDANPSTSGLIEDVITQFTTMIFEKNAF